MLKHVTLAFVLFGLVAGIFLAEEKISKQEIKISNLKSDQEQAFQLLGIKRIPECGNMYIKR